MENAVIIGNGVLGQATGEAFGIADRYDIDPLRRTIEIEEVVKRKYIFICLPTPTSFGACDTSIIYETIAKFIKQGLSKDSILIIRSTVYPGFNRYLQSSFKINQFVSNPEFISNDTALEDMAKPDLIVVGGENQEAVSQVVALYKSRFKYPEPIVTDSTTAEFIKYSLNSFFALKVVFANQLFDGAQQLKANYEVVRKVLESHKWGSKNHLEAFHKGGRGYWGKCLPKDVEAFSEIIDSDLLRTVHGINLDLVGEGGKNG